MDVAALLAEAGALLEGHFELRSGLHSARYFQCARIMEDPKLLERLCGELAQRLRAVIGGMPIDTVAAPAMGGIIVGYELARALGARSIFVEKDSEGRLMLRRFQIRSGEKVVVAEDVVTRGGRVQETTDIIRRHGGKVVATAVIVDRSGGAFVPEERLVSLLESAPEVWRPEECPLCARGEPLVHPGS